MTRSCLFRKKIEKIRKFIFRNNGRFEPKRMVRKYKLCRRIFFRFFEIFRKNDLIFLIFSTIFRQRLDMTACLPLQGCIVQITSLQAKTEKLSAKTEIFFVIFSEF
jgi:hypothetical protein